MRVLELPFSSYLLCSLKPNMAWMTTSLGTRVPYLRVVSQVCPFSWVLRLPSGAGMDLEPSASAPHSEAFFSATTALLTCDTEAVSPKHRGIHREKMVMVTSTE